MFSSVPFKSLQKLKIQAATMIKPVDEVYGHICLIFDCCL